MKIVCFDFDGTLADSFKFVYYSFDKIFYKYLGIHMTDALFDKLSGPTEEGFLMKEFGDDYKKEYWDEYLDLYKKESPNFIQLFPGNKEMLFDLKKKGYHLVFLTGRSKETAEISLKNFGIYDLFEGFYAGSINGCVKDELLKEVAKDFKVDTKDVLYVGDSIQDIKDAKKASCPIISVLFSNPQWWTMIKSMNSNYASTPIELEEKIDEFYEQK